MYQFEALADFQFLFGGAVGQPLNVLALPFDVLRQRSVAFLRLFDLMLLLDQRGDASGAAQRHRGIAGHQQKCNQINSAHQRDSHCTKRPEDNGTIGFRFLFHFFEMADEIVVLSTCSSADEAEKLARLLVEERLAACVSIVPGVRSFYRWQGAVESAAEWMLLAKSSRSLFPALAAALGQAHSYEVPEVVALPVSDGSAKYLEWLAAGLRNPESV
jgi:periplasmic divalent cation tolerance protein